MSDRSERTCPEHMVALRPRFLEHEGGRGTQWNCPEPGCPYYELQQPASVR